MPLASIILLSSQLKDDLSSCGDAKGGSGGLDPFSALWASPFGPLPFHTRMKDNGRCVDWTAVEQLVGVTQLLPCVTDVGNKARLRGVELVNGDWILRANQLEVIERCSPNRRTTWPQRSSLCRKKVACSIGIRSIGIAG